MYLVDTSVWIDHFRKKNSSLSESLVNGLVYTHPFVVGELSLGSLSKRSEVLASIANLSQAIVAADEEVIEMISKRKMHGKGIGYVDAHLLASVMLSNALLLWTHDKRLNTVAVELGISRQP